MPSPYIRSGYHLNGVTCQPWRRCIRSLAVGWLDRHFYLDISVISVSSNKFSYISIDMYIFSFFLLTSYSQRTKLELMNPIKEGLVSVDPSTGCWLWKGRMFDNGYGWFGGKSANRRIWEMMLGPISDGLVLHHLCSVKRCVNPSHMEPVTWAVNLKRGSKFDGFMYPSEPFQKKIIRKRKVK